MLFHDLDADGEQDVNEPGLDGRTVFLDANDNGVLEEGEPWTVMGLSGPNGTAPSVAGAFSLSPLSPGSYRLAADAGAGWRRVERRIERVSVGKGGREAEGWSYLSSISGDGRFVAFVYRLRIWCSEIRMVRKTSSCTTCKIARSRKSAFRRCVGIQAVAEPRRTFCGV